MGQFKEFLQYIFEFFKIWVIIQPWESGLIVRNGRRIKKKSGGIYFKIPYFDSVYVQENRLRVSLMALQTLTSKDMKTITIGGSIGYSISDLERLYSTLYTPETTISNIVMNEMAEFIHNNNVNAITPKKIEGKILKVLKSKDYGLDFEYFKITNFAVVKTFRLIQDQSWTDETLYMSKKKI